jgi:hypothetical protein
MREEMQGAALALHEQVIAVIGQNVKAQLPVIGLGPRILAHGDLGDLGEHNGGFVAEK